MARGGPSSSSGTARAGIVDGRPWCVFADALAGTGRRVVLYNFLYSERRQRRPDPPAVLEATTRAVAEHARDAFGADHLVQGGRSMGGRIASQVVATGAPADALVFLAYPLHPPGQPDRLRDRHLPDITVPMLFVQGTRDAFARPDLLDAVIARLGSRARLHPRRRRRPLFWRAEELRTDGRRGRGGDALRRS